MVLLCLFFFATHPLEQALQLLNSGKYQQSFEIAADYVREHPESPSGHKIAGMDEYMLGQPREAILELRRATELNPRDPEAFYYLGRLYFSADDVNSALSMFQKALEIEPGSVRARNHLGQTLEALGRFADAERAYLEAIGSEATQPKRSEWPFYNLGVLYLNSGRSEQAVPYLQQALERNPAMVEAKVKLALAFAGMHRGAEAAGLLEEAIRLDSKNAEAHYRLARLLAKSGKHDEAQRHFDLFERYRKH